MSLQQAVPTLQRFIVLLLCLLAGMVSAAEIPHARGLLFKVTAPGGAASHLFGTIHSEDPRVLKLAPPVERAFGQARQLVVEARMDPAAILASMSAMLLTDGRTLESLLGRALYRKTAAAAAQRGIPEVALQSYKPWAVATLLSVPPSTTGQFLDLVLFNRALQGGKPVTGLETLQEQLGLFDRLSMADQKQMLQETLNNLDLLPKLFQEMHEGYLDRNLGALVEMNERHPISGESATLAEFQRELIEGRNHRMVERLREHLRQGGLFVAVGALHLPGKEGILSLLEQQGYQVARIY